MTKSWPIKYPKRNETYPKSTNCKRSPKAAGKNNHFVYIPSLPQLSTEIHFRLRPVTPLNGPMVYVHISRFNFKQAHKLITQTPIKYSTINNTHFNSKKYLEELDTTIKCLLIASPHGTYAIAYKWSSRGP